ncbi:signal peptidase I [Basilea psittacipulmonis]|uniref:Signal peptidase I n=1 Tax=Basilea psittacipulmonis DSM 24701 TaxID=1072685 RepID=A0A077DEI7_9BURK|nr:signal peptidase I [Basilea psittacipulmonis]AIL33240.1 hypothetical protein IX83_07980 [Basilea psittacipulmonis DSM 24701]
MSWVDVLSIVIFFGTIFCLVVRIIGWKKWRHQEEKDRRGIVNFAYGWTSVFVFLFVCRFILAEPFRIPSASMLPTLEVGDMVLVEHFSYGFRLPVLNTKVIPVSSPKRGDVIIFRYPKDWSTIFIKRVIGEPGDTVAYHKKQLIINGKPLRQEYLGPYINPEQMRSMGNVPAYQYREYLEDGTSYLTLQIPAFTSKLPEHPDFPYAENCTFSGNDFECKVPEGHYFVMGDDRDNSEDSRFWGFVPDKNVAGKAYFIMMNLKGNFKRIGTFD